MDPHLQQPADGRRDGLIIQMKLSIAQTGLLLIVAVFTTALVTRWIRPTGSPTNVSTSTSFDAEILAFQRDLARAKKQRAIVAKLENSHYHITYDYLSTPSSDPAPAVERLVDTYGRDFVGQPYYIGNSHALENIDLLSQLSSIQNADFDDSGITDDDLLHLKELPRLRVLFLNSTSISESGLKHLDETAVEILHLQNCPNVDDGCIPVLSRMESLRKLYISERNFSPAGIQQLKSALPDCAIE